jgi:hypothetical protein
VAAERLPLVSIRPCLGREFGDSTGRKVSQAREYRGKIVTNLDLKSPTGFNDRDVCLRHVLSHI